MIKLFRTCAAVVVFAAAMLGFMASPANAEPVQDCKTVVTSVVNRPDNGHGTGGTPQPGYWADDTHKRTITICREVHASPSASVTPKLVVPSDNYTAKGVDDGTFVTRAGAHLSPNDGMPLAGGVKGKLYGTFEWKITAPANWQFFDASKFDGKTVTGDPKASDSDDNPSTSMWVNGFWGKGVETHIVFNEANWSWLYWLCGSKPDLKDLAKYRGEYWWDAGSQLSNDGTTHLAGDIHGRQVCPSPSASPSASVAPSASATAAPVPGGQSGSGSLPVTGAPIPIVAGTGAVLAAVGAFLFWRTRRNRVRFAA